MEISPLGASVHLSTQQVTIASGINPSISSTRDYKTMTAAILKIQF
jgi:hypothetical protein